MIFGDNGSGKTSLLESIFFLATGKSFRESKIAHLINRGANYFSVEGKFSGHRIKAVYQPGVKVFYMDESQVAQSVVKEEIPLIYVGSGEDFFQGHPVFRRSEINRIIGRFDKEYEENILMINRILKHKRDVLDKGRYSILPALNKPLCNVSEKISRQRADFFSKIETTFKQYAEIFFDKNVELMYIPNPIKCNEDVIKKEQQSRRILCGAQRDDFTALVNDMDARVYMSQGEKRIIFLCFIFAVRDILESVKDRETLLLLDETCSILDDKNRERLLNINLPQVIFTSPIKIETGVNEIHLNLSYEKIR